MIKTSEFLTYIEHKAFDGYIALKQYLESPASDDALEHELKDFYSEKLTSLARKAGWIY